MQARQAIRERAIPAPPQLTDDMLDEVRRTRLSPGHTLVAYGGANRYSGQIDSPPLLRDRLGLTELVDEFDPATGHAVLAAEFFGEWYCVEGDQSRSDPVYLTWVLVDGIWHLEMWTQHCA
jgi:hypothetical protein